MGSQESPGTPLPTTQSKAEAKLNDLEISLQKQSKENKTLTEKVIKIQAIGSFP